MCVYACVYACVVCLLTQPSTGTCGQYLHDFQGNLLCLNLAAPTGPQCLEITAAAVCIAVASAQQPTLRRAVLYIYLPSSHHAAGVPGARCRHDESFWWMHMQGHFTSSTTRRCGMELQQQQTCCYQRACGQLVNASILRIDRRIYERVSFRIPFGL